MLTDEQIYAVACKHFTTGNNLTEYQVVSHGRAIESAATDPLLERIAGLERQLEQAQKDAERYQWLRDSKIEDDAQEWVCAGVFDMGGVVEIDGEALDEAIDAAIQSKEKP